MLNQALAITSTTLYSIIAGLIPVLLWLWFWLKEDPHPEPRKLIILTFVAGAIVVPIALLFEEIIYNIAIATGITVKGAFPFILLFLWAAVEEISKYRAAKWAALRKKAFDEPVDALVYLITAALGFAAFENILFLFKAFIENPALGILTGQMRFLGATLLHTLSSAIVGISISFSFFHKEHRSRNIIGGIVLATLLHAFFNFSILKRGDEGVLFIFFLLWLGAILLIFFFEKIKSIKQ